MVRSVQVLGRADHAGGRAELLSLLLIPSRAELWREAERNLKGGKVLWLDVVPLKGGKRDFSTS